MVTRFMTKGRGKTRKVIPLKGRTARPKFIKMDDLEIQSRTHTVHTGGGFEFTFKPVDGTLQVKETKDGYTVKYVAVDETPEDPRVNWSNCGKMTMMHDRYDLPEEAGIGDIDFKGWTDMKATLVKDKKATVILPIYMYDHSGVTINTTGYSCPWDSGQVGFIYATDEGIKEYYGVDKITPVIRKQARAMLENEVKAYDQFLTGDIYLCVSEKYDKDKVQVDYDVVGGYFGLDYAQEELKTFEG